MSFDIERDIEPYLDSSICNRYWHIQSDHKMFREICSAIDTGGGQTCNVAGVLRELDKAGFVIKLK